MGCTRHGITDRKRKLELLNHEDEYVGLDNSVIMRGSQAK